MVFGRLLVSLTSVFVSIAVLLVSEAMETEVRQTFGPDYLLTPYNCTVSDSDKQFEGLVNLRCPIFPIPTSSLDETSFIQGSFASTNPALDQLQRYKCAEQQPTAAGFLPMVHIVNASVLLDILFRNETLNWCILVNFYAPWCPFSARLAPYFNALPRAAPQLLTVAVDATEYTRLNSRYGILGTPTILLFHNGKPVARFNASDFSLAGMKAFLNKHTDLAVDSDISIEDQDMFGPLPTKPLKKTDFNLILAWVFILACSMYHMTKLSFIQRLIELLRRNWREANEDNQ